jgi:nucleoid-associated protein YgaU
MDRLQELKLKYGSVLTLIARGGVRLDHLHVKDDKLYMQGVVCSEDVNNDLWNQIKAVDPSFSDLTCDLTIDPSLPAPPPAETMYTVVAGDSLWAIAARFYGNGGLFRKIIAANPDKLKDEKSVIHPGDQLRIPPAG